MIVGTKSPALLYRTDRAVSSILHRENKKYLSILKETGRGWVGSSPDRSSKAE